MRGKIGVWALACGVLFTQTSNAMTIQEVIDTLGDIAALEQICPMATYVQNDSVMVSFFNKNNVKWELFDYSGPYHADIDVAQEKAFARRLYSSVKRNCLDAIELYGPDGSVHNGLFKGAAGKVEPLTDVPIQTLMDTMGDIIALEQICPYLQVDEAATHRYLTTTGFMSLTDKVRYRIGDNILPAKRRAFSKRKAQSVEENCADALRLYGPSGTVVPGHYNGLKRTATAIPKTK